MIAMLVLCAITIGDQTASAASRDASTVGPRQTASRRSSKIFVSNARRQSRSLSRNVRRTRVLSQMGCHEPNLTPAHDEMIAQSTEQSGAGLCDAEQFTGDTSWETLRKARAPRRCTGLRKPTVP
jgi:hypothetical protein